MKKNPMLDGSRVVKICYDPMLHLEWKSRVVVIALIAFTVGMLVQWTLHLLP